MRVGVGEGVGEGGQVWERVGEGGVGEGGGV